MGVVKFDPSVKIIVLLRDTRAIYSSRTLGWPAPTKRNDTMANPPGWNGASGFPYDQSLKSLCMEHIIMQKRAEESTEQTLLVEYEQVLRDPHGLAKRVFSHIGVPSVPQKVVDHIDKNIKGNCEHLDAPFSVCRKLDPNAVDNKWKTKLDAKALNDLLKVEECKTVVKKYEKRDGDAAGGGSAATSTTEEL